jgi:hypothetical protein
VKHIALLLAVSSMGIFVPSAFADMIFTLNDWCVNVNGDTGTCNDPNTGLPLNGNIAAGLSTFDTTTAAFGTNSLGSIVVTLGPGLNQNVGFYADYDVRYGEFLSNNDNALTSGTLAAGQSYQIGDPSATGSTTPSGFVLFDAFANDNLTNTNTLGTPGSDPQCCDVAFAMGFDGINLASAQTAQLTFTVSSTQPTSGFYITQATNSDEGGTLYLNGSLVITGDSPIPEPSTFLLGLSALAVIGFAARRRLAASSRA